ncbi:16S rRNA (guanine(527)-N(7))-methyltransferase RsmG [Synechococcus sp. CS-602]|uniref:16S rRNA (guanine(527)-N(7))-methyltransferase RsmG n=1 Tax=Synechococcaceae TaxID=1890426 RepID=UPI0008FF78B4|nr:MULTISPECIES: 16S rRNA (guanine(527)-N(7))-methyltransferase RsmG [Synechococcaceae]MCT4363449.1 16S rRNA (guanine(527)-N(7))-methyltransferase RsmG [Candidatus Regnicoccus frigidus MAG-AL1]APD48478.1 16S rRNA (guanine(527)-N(7))-methyltransferase RsmG [Synechococcus sp. SynAce01]MCT0203261.1 16S rRNA (guanine(527)-N(7))-methyltransferase RsmG [Synechococcus sp. CS-603]MCT0205259.1 16S rRNA (guanine(527)-N(7))-methyltransferase RsmG [Synechococcus sp. CS-602]MCT0246753.1 16S rRNA (guanine(5
MAAEQDDAVWSALAWQPSATQREQFLALQQVLRHWNSRLNLTRLVEGDDYWISQLYDSLWPWQQLLRQPPTALSLIDVGTGGGFPGLALAIALPQAQVTLVDSVGRKAEAVRAMAHSLGLSQRVMVRWERAETTGQDPDCRGRFDWALARAVAAAPVVAEYLVPLLAPTGHALLYRGQWEPADQQSLERALQPLLAAAERVERCDLPSARGVRHAVVLRPLAPCPASYPRPVGVPAKLPLGVL